MRRDSNSSSGYVHDDTSSRDLLAEIAVPRVSDLSYSSKLWSNCKLSAMTFPNTFWRSQRICFSRVWPLAFPCISQKTFRAASCSIGCTSTHRDSPNICLKSLGGSAVIDTLCDEEDMVDQRVFGPDSSDRVYSSNTNLPGQIHVHQNDYSWIPTEATESSIAHHGFVSS